MSLLKSMLMSVALGERHDYAVENPEFQGLDSFGPRGMGAPNKQRWSAPVNKPQQGLEQGTGRSPGWRWPSMPHTLHDNPLWQAVAGIRHPAAKGEPHPEYHGWTAPSYYQQYDKPRPFGGITGVVLAIRAGIPFSATRVEGNGAPESMGEGEGEDIFAPSTSTLP